MQKKALGKGLEALLPRLAMKDSSRIMDVALDRLDPNPRQPRKVFDQEQLEELATSIKTSGVIQPILVRPQGDRYVVVVGERRVRASRLAGLASIPALVKEVSDDSLLQMALIENIQREDLNPIELARAYQEYLSRFSSTQEELAEIIGKDRSFVANTIRLLNLDPEIQNAVSTGRLSPGHARGLLAIPDPLEQSALAERIVNETWTVRQTEEFARKRKKKKKPAATRTTQPDPAASVDPNLVAIRDRLMRFLGTRVILDVHETGGDIVISYYDDDDLTRLTDLIMGRNP